MTPLGLKTKRCHNGISPMSKSTCTHDALAVLLWIYRSKRAVFPGVLSPGVLSTRPCVVPVHGLAPAYSGWSLLGTGVWHARHNYTHLLTGTQVTRKWHTRCDSDPNASASTPPQLHSILVTSPWHLRRSTAQLTAERPMHSNYSRRSGKGLRRSLVIASALVEVQQSFRVLFEEH